MRYIKAIVLSWFFFVLPTEFSARTLPDSTIKKIDDLHEVQVMISISNEYLYVC